MLSDQSIRLFKYIVRKIDQGRIRADQPNTFLTYKSVHDDLGLELNGPTYGISLLYYGLTELATFLRDNNEPALSGLIVNQEDDQNRPSLPGEDYFRFHNREIDDYEWWLSQVRASINHDWDTILRIQLANDEISLIYPDEVSDDEDFVEGAVKQVIVNQYERSNKGRTRCLQHHGYNCTVCNLNFNDKYGEIGRNFIHVHHLIPLSNITEEYALNPVEDLRPVCPNCHAMIHRRKPPFSIDELRDKLK